MRRWVVGPCAITVGPVAITVGPVAITVGPMSSGEPVSSGEGVLTVVGHASAPMTSGYSKVTNQTSCRLMAATSAPHARDRDCDLMQAVELLGDGNATQWLLHGHSGIV